MIPEEVKRRLLDAEQIAISINSKSEIIYCNYFDGHVYSLNRESRNFEIVR